MSELLPLGRTGLQIAFDALRDDLVTADGPRISTMRNYRFAIVPYEPTQEMALRNHVQRLSHELIAHGWNVLSISLHKLLLDRIRGLGAEEIAWVARTERVVGAHDPVRSLDYLKDQLSALVEGPDGLAADCARLIQAHVALHPDRAERTVVFIGRAGALYPFFRSSALLRHLDGRTGNVPVVLLYPGTRHGLTGLSFMGRLKPDNDYRPRIYP